MSSTITGPMFKWFGSKWQASKHYPQPEFPTIHEPFAGGAAYSLRHYDKQVVIAEKNEQLADLWRWLIQATTQDILDIPLDMPVGSDIRNLGLSYGQALLVKHWQRTNNVGNCWLVSPWSGKPGQWGLTARSRTAEQVHAIRHWKVLDDGESLLASGGEATWFIDPIYQYNYDYRMARHDYVQLAEKILAVQGQIIACEAACQKTGAVPNYLPFEPFRRTITSRRKAGCNNYSTELVYCRSGVSIPRIEVPFE